MARRRSRGTGTGGQQNAQRAASRRRRIATVIEAETHSPTPTEVPADQHKVALEGRATLSGSGKLFGTPEVPPHMQGAAATGGDVPPPPSRLPPFIHNQNMDEANRIAIEIANRQQHLSAALSQPMPPLTPLPAQEEAARTAILQGIASLEARLNEFAPILQLMRQHLERGEPLAPGMGHNKPPEELP